MARRLKGVARATRDDENLIRMALCGQGRGVLGKNPMMNLTRVAVVNPRLSL